jgi:hypothetical protein
LKIKIKILLIQYHCGGRGKFVFKIFFGFRISSIFGSEFSEGGGGGGLTAGGIPSEQLQTAPPLFSSHNFSQISEEYLNDRFKVVDGGGGKTCFEQKIRKNIFDFPVSNRWQSSSEMAISGRLISSEWIDSAKQEAARMRTNNLLHIFRVSCNAVKDLRMKHYLSTLQFIYQSASFDVD